MKCAAMQPTYLPWAGYFNLISRVDKFVFLDDVQFEKRSWQSRNRILLDGRYFFLSVPVEKSPRETLVKDVRISSHGNWFDLHYKNISHAYKKKPYGDQVLDFFSRYGKKDYRYLIDLNVDFILGFLGLFGVESDIVFSSGLGCGGKRSWKISNICKYVGCDEYLSPPGSKEYLEADDFQEIAGVKLIFNNFVPVPYNQGEESFSGYASVLDVIANLGVESAERYVKGEDTK